MSDDQQPDRAVETLPNSGGAPSDVASPQSIQLRADARLAARIKFLQAECDGKSALIATLSAELAQLRAAVADVNARIKVLEAELAKARADRDYEQRNFARLLAALQSAKSGEYQHIAEHLRRTRTQ